ncbi:proteasome regulatory non-ATPase subunit 8, putative, partial [Bodo saltans]
MFRMYKKVLPKISVVGWYSSGPTICANDMNLHLLIANRFCANPVYCVVNTDATKKATPVLAYTTIAGRDGAAVEFRNVPTNLGALEAEEIGIEHLLRDLTDSTVTTLSTQVLDRQLSLQRLEQMLTTLQQYLLDVADGRLPMCLDILEIVQEIVNLRPRLHQLKASKEMVMWTNDSALSTFVAAASRCVMALYDVILNRRRLSRELKESKERR